MQEKRRKRQKKPEQPERKLGIAEAENQRLESRRRNRGQKPDAK
jgi:hypothetical protein